MKKFLKYKEEKASIVLYVMVSMLFFTIVLVSLYVSSSNKIQKQNKEINKIQQSYEQQNIDELYNKAL